jgi:RimJ/RimL family protein N-acetyltransferase
MAFGVELRPVTLANRGDLDDIDVGEDARFWVHSNWYWHQWSVERPDILFRLIHLEGQAEAVGMVAVGPFYEDEALTRRVPGVYEVIHLAIDHHWQRQGIGVRVARAAVALLAALPDCHEIRVAHHPDNLASRSLFLSLGFAPAEAVNYEGDPLLALQPSAAV